MTACSSNAECVWWQICKQGYSQKRCAWTECASNDDCTKAGIANAHCAGYADVGPSDGLVLPPYSASGAKICLR